MRFKLLLGLVLAHSASATYRLLQDYTGDAFFENFDFYTAADPTDGHVVFQSLQEANATGLAGFLLQNNTEKAVYLGVDSKSAAPQGRGATRVTSVQSFNHGLVIADIAHMPGGVCGVWPAFWMVGPNWPSNGEIDIVEGVNLQTTNSMTLHTAEGVVINNNTEFLGDIITSNCYVDAPNQDANSGCSISDISNLTFGGDFNAIGGGIFATEWTSDFIKIWFFPRDAIPAGLNTTSPQPDSTWGTPNSMFQGNFSIDEHFKNLQIVFDTTFCGTWAGDSYVWAASSCSKYASTCEDFVSNNPSAFEDAYWAINSLQVFADDGTTTFNTQDRR